MMYPSKRIMWISLANLAAVRAVVLRHPFNVVWSHIANRMGHEFGGKCDFFIIDRESMEEFTSL
ncbi:hypothetical protein [Roseobacter cerasinus]|uniref:hypothetical protein n=1 Tax=Roseobacter cerasinus TaxID=2602289 RepID=UPI00135983AE|nr:hypothetical protein [Roseobacter cerasinus]